MVKPHSQPRELFFTINGFVFAAQSWGNENDFPVLALHGWLDNSASFSILAPELDGVYLVAIDLAGHGQSNHRQGIGAYNIWEDVAEIFAIADSLGWQEFALLGHSRGGIIATLAAGTFPERITHLGLIEGFVPEPHHYQDTPKQLALSIKAIKSQAEKSLSLYPDIASAIAVRENGMFPLSHHAASVLTERGLKKVQGGFQWSTDQRLLAPSAIKLSPEQVGAFVGRITAPIQLILGHEGMLKLYAVYKGELAKYPHIPIVNFPGGHHLHMEQQVYDVASTLKQFFSKSI